MILKERTEGGGSSAGTEKVLQKGKLIIDVPRICSTNDLLGGVPFSLELVGFFVLSGNNNEGVTNLNRFNDV